MLVPWFRLDSDTDASSETGAVPGPGMFSARGTRCPLSTCDTRTATLSLSCPRALHSQHEFRATQSTGDGRGLSSEASVPGPGWDMRPRPPKASIALPGRHGIRGGVTERLTRQPPHSQADSSAWPWALQLSNGLGR